MSVLRPGRTAGDVHRCSPPDSQQRTAVLEVRSFACLLSSALGLGRVPQCRLRPKRQCSLFKGVRGNDVLEGRRPRSLALDPRLPVASSKLKMQAAWMSWTSDANAHIIIEQLFDLYVSPQSRVLCRLSRHSSSSSPR